MEHIPICACGCVMRLSSNENYYYCPKCEVPVYAPSEEDETCDSEICDNCNGLGYLFPWGDDTGLACVERCDICKKFTDDDEAAIELCVDLQKKVGTRYTVSRIVLPGHSTEDPGSVRSVVMELERANEDSVTYTVLDFEDGAALEKKLRRPDIEDFIKAAKEHGELSESDHEVGDLQGMLRKAWELLPDRGRRKLAEAHEELLQWK